MKNETAHGKKFATLLKKIRKEHAGEPLPELDPIALLIVSFLEWNATRGQALAAHGRLMSEMVDNNDLRVTHLTDLVRLAGADYPQVQERMARMIESLQEIYLREHAVSLASIAEKSKKQVRTYLESLPGIPYYAAAQVLLLGFGGHAIPTDDRLVELLSEHKCIEPGATASEVGPFLERQIKAADAAEAHQSLRAWVDAHAGQFKDASPAPAAEADEPRRAKTTRKTKTTRKSTARKTTRSSRKSTTK